MTPLEPLYGWQRFLNGPREPRYISVVQAVLERTAPLWNEPPHHEPSRPHSLPSQPQPQPQPEVTADIKRKGKRKGGKKQAKKSVQQNHLVPGATPAAPIAVAQELTLFPEEKKEEKEEPKVVAQQHTEPVEEQPESSAVQEQTDNLIGSSTDPMAVAQQQTLFPVQKKEETEVVTPQNAESVEEQPDPKIAAQQNTLFPEPMDKKKDEPLHEAQQMQQLVPKFSTKVKKLIATAPGHPLSQLVRSELKKDNNDIQKISSAEQDGFLVALSTALANPTMKADDVEQWLLSMTLPKITKDSKKPEGGNRLSGLTAALEKPKVAPVVTVQPAPRKPKPKPKPKPLDAFIKEILALEFDNAALKAAIQAYVTVSPQEIVKIPKYTRHQFISELIRQGIQKYPIKFQKTEAGWLQEKIKHYNSLPPYEAKTEAFINKLKADTALYKAQPLYTLVMKDLDYVEQMSDYNRSLYLDNLIKRFKQSARKPRSVDKEAEWLDNEIGIRLRSVV